MIVSHESVIAGLKLLLKQDLFKLDPEAQALHMLGESDRATIILLAATIEHTILRWLEIRMPSLNSDERQTIFNFEGPCGSFSNRLRLAHALGLFDRPGRKRIEIVKEMRNTAAHSFAKIQFDLPQIKEAVAHIFPLSAREEVMGWDVTRVRAAFTTFCMHQTQAIVKGKTLDVAKCFEWVRSRKVRPQPWLDTPQEE